MGENFVSLFERIADLLNFIPLSTNITEENKTNWLKT